MLIINIYFTTSEPYREQVCTDIRGYDKHMYNMNMVVTDTITKIQLLTQKCGESNFEYVFCNLENKEKKKNEVHRKKQIIKLANTKSFYPQKHTFMKTNRPNISQSFGVPNVFFAYLLSKSQSGSKRG